MKLANGSRWRIAARRSMREALAALPPGRSEKDVLKAIRDAYPFGQRANHPYACWLAERKILLKNMGFAKAEDREEKPTINFALTQKPVARDKAILWLCVACGWCEERFGSGCLMCGRERLMAERAADEPLFRQLRRAEREGDALARMAMDDWLTERFGERYVR